MKLGSKLGSIEGVVVKNLLSHQDSRGFFREIVRSTDEIFEMGRFGQWSHSLMAKDTVKAWHFHHLQSDWWYIPIGLGHTVLIDSRKNSPTYGQRMEFYMGSENVGDKVAEQLLVRIPPGVLHGVKVLSDMAHLFYITSETYNPQDEGRIPFNSPEIDWNWGNPEQLIVAPRDTVLHIPPYDLQY